MKEVVIYLVLIIVANFLCLKFAFAQDNTRFFALAGFLIGIYFMFQFSFKVGGLLSNRDFSYSMLFSESAKNDKTLNKPAFIFLATLVFIIGLHIWGYIEFFKSQDDLLNKKGILTKAITVDKKWEKKDRGSSFKYYIYYAYEENGKIYSHSQPNDTIEVGDTIIVKILPKNPDNHLIIGKQNQ